MKRKVISSLPEQIAAFPGDALVDTFNRIWSSGKYDDLNEAMKPTFAALIDSMLPEYERRFSPGLVPIAWSEIKQKLIVMANSAMHWTIGQGLGEIMLTGEDIFRGVHNSLERAFPEYINASVIRDDRVFVRFFLEGWSFDDILQDENMDKPESKQIVKDTVKRICFWGMAEYFRAYIDKVLSMPAQDLKAQDELFAKVLSSVNPIYFTQGMGKALEQLYEKYPDSKGLKNFQNALSVFISDELNKPIVTSYQISELMNNLRDEN